MPYFLETVKQDQNSAFLSLLKKDRLFSMVR